MADKLLITSLLCSWILTVALYTEGWASMELTRAAMLGFLVSPPAGGWVIVAPINIIGSRKIFGRISGARMVLIPPSLAFIFRHRLEIICKIVEGKHL